MITDPVSRVLSAMAAAALVYDACEPSGLAVKPGHRAVYYVDDATNTLNLLHS